MTPDRPFIRYVTRKWPPAVGGMETYSQRLAEFLQDHGELDVIALPGRKDGRAPGMVELMIFGVTVFFRLLFARRTGDVTHIGDLASWPLGLAARWRRAAAPVVISAHGTDVSFAFRPGPANRLYRLYLGLGRRLLSDITVIANSRATAAALSRLGFKDTPVVPLAADPAPDAAPGSPGMHLLFAGRLVRRKGLRWFVDHVLDRLPPEITLHVAGPVWDADEEVALSHDRVTHLGTLAAAELRQAYRSALAVIVPNLDLGVGHLEGFGLVAPEAAAAGAVVIGADTGGLRDAILDGETGFLAAPGDAPAWAAQIETIRNWSPEARENYVARSRGACERHFNWQRVAADTFTHYGVNSSSRTAASSAQMAAKDGSQD